MRKYVIISMKISNIGGAQQYIYNKYRYLTEKGWNAYIFSSLDREVLIEGLRQFIPLITPALMYSPILFRDKEKDNIISSICKKISYKEDDEVIVESNSIAAAEWGELLAKKINAKHIVLSVQEKHALTPSQKAFMKFKLDRHELAGINKLSVSQMLEDPQLPYRDDMSFAAICYNVVEDCDDHFSEKLDQKAKYTFGSIGRLTKPYILPIISKILDYCKKNPDDKFNIVLIGGAPQKRLDEIKKIVNSVNNISLVITGLMYPIPRSLVKNVDLFISSAGSAKVSYNECVPTIKVGRDGKTLGIWGYSYTVGNLYTALESESIEEEIEMIFEKKIKIDFPDDAAKETSNKQNTEFSKQLSMALCLSNKLYYDISQVKCDLRSKKNKLYYMLGHIFGSKQMQNILELGRKFLYVTDSVE